MIKTNYKEVIILETFHNEILVVQESFKKAIILNKNNELSPIVHEIAYANYYKDMESLKELIARFRKKDYNIKNGKYKDINIKEVYDENNIIESCDYSKNEITVEDCLLQIGYAESSIKKLIKDFKYTELEGNEYIIAVLNTIPSRSKYKKPSLEIIKQLEGNK
jgi:hypothetical protein